MPAELTIREFRVRVQDKTKRVRKLVVVTTLTDAADYPAKELGSLFRQRWYAELDLRTLKTDMRMEMLRTKSPEMVRKEIAVHLLGYNLIRGVMAEAARAAMVHPRQLSFKGCIARGAVVRGGASVRPGADRGGLAPAVAAHRQEAGGGPSRPLRAAGGEAASRTAPAAADDAEEGPSIDQTWKNTL